MATFKCEKYPGLMVHGAGKFKNGELTVTKADAVKRVKSAAQRFGITEVKSESKQSTKTAADSKSQ